MAKRNIEKHFSVLEGTGLDIAKEDDPGTYDFHHTYDSGSIGAPLL